MQPDEPRILERKQLTDVQEIHGASRCGVETREALDDIETRLEISDVGTNLVKTHRSIVHI